jgi:hypothetical protein
MRCLFARGPLDSLGADGAAALRPRGAGGIVTRAGHAAIRVAGAHAGAGGTASAGGVRTAAGNASGLFRYVDARHEHQQRLRKALRTLVISHHEPGFVVNDALDHTQFLTTDDKPADQQIGAQTISTATHWEGTHLVTEYTLSDRHKLVFTYTLLAETKQMVLRVRLDDTERRRVVGQEVKLAYTLAPPAAR